MSYQFLFRVSLTLCVSASLLPSAVLLPSRGLQDPAPVNLVECPPSVGYWQLLAPFHFFFPHLLRACWNCVVLIPSAVLPLVAHSLSSRSIRFGVCIPAPCVSPLYALSGRDWIGTEGEDFNPKSLKTRNKWKSMESRCGIWTTKG